MPPARSIRQRPIGNENDENTTVRLTRAKAAALGGSEDAVNVGLAKKPLQSKKSSTNTLTSQVQKKRAALGDVSNVTKTEVLDVKEAKKTYAGRAALVSKTTQNAGVQKLSRTNSTRSILGAKDGNKRPSSAERKRPASGSGVLGGVAKKRNTNSSGSQQTLKEESVVSENEPAVKQSVTVEIEKRVNDETKDATKVEQIKKEIKKELKQEVKQEIKHQVKQEVQDEVFQEVRKQFAAGVRDLDQEDAHDPLMVAEYVGEIFDYLMDIEGSTMPNPDYMEHQDHLEWNLRGVLVDWLVEVHLRFHLLPETLYIAVNIVDRFLSAKVVQLEKLQLVGITALFIASKYEEVLSPHVTNFRNVADDGYTEVEILSAERYILQALNYDLSYPNPLNFLRRISKADRYDVQTRTVAKYLLEISCLDHKFMEFLPSHIAAAAMYVARIIIGRGGWNATLEHYSGYSEEDIAPLYRLMIEYLRSPIQHEAFFKKYASKKYLKASILTRQWAKKYYPLHATTDEASTEEFDDSYTSQDVRTHR
ncbi:MAG: G2/mitotic-specific cyclin [Icmadophila ericetorum]|nr:G2/mitotic-specific cyclin [Icmadophila ericetorum]